MPNLRAAIYDRLRILSSPGVRRFIKNQPWFVPLSQRLFGNEVYSDSYYADIERLENQSVVHIAAWIAKHLTPDTPGRKPRAIDIGCGPGHLMHALEQHSYDTFGIDIATAALARTKAKGLLAEPFDLTAPDRTLPGIPYDLVISCEVAEHLDAQHAARFVEHLTSAGDVIFLTAAEPNANGGPGLYHVHEQPNAYWIQRLEAAGFALDQDATDRARAAFQATDVIDYLAKPMIFRRGAKTP